MIVGLEGILERRGAEWAVIKVGGVSLQVYMPSSTLSKLGDIGDKVQLHTHLHLREDNVALYGFASIEELGIFQNLIGVSGTGPKMALAILSAMSPDQLAMAIASGNVDLLTQVPGVGRKVASRLILELKGKLGRGWEGAPALELAQENADVMAALTALGYSASEAIRAVASIPGSTDLSLEDRVRIALQQLGTG